MHITSNPNWRRIFESGLSTVAATALLLAASPAWGGPPFVTDDPEPVEYRHTEMHFAAEQVITQSGKVVVPLVEYNYGVLPDLQLSFTVPYVQNTPAGQARMQGMGDLVVGAKYRFLQETDTQPMMSVYPVLVAANGDASRGLGNGGPQLFLPIWMQKKWDDWLAYGGGGYWINRAPGGANRWYYGFVLQNNITESLSLGGEVYREAEQLPVESESTGFSLGGTYHLDQHNHLLLSSRRGTTEHTSLTKYSTYIAYGLTW